VTLLNNGFIPVACDGKRALVDGWSEIHAPTELLLKTWSETHQRCQNTGILTRFAPAFDIDLLDEDAAQAVEDLTRQWFAARGLILDRIGQWPKRLILFRTDVPFKKIARTFAKGGKLEVLGDGQQFVAFGTHPDTGRPYGWGDKSPRNVKRPELPYISEAGARELVQAAVNLLVEHFGYQIPKPRPVPPRPTVPAASFNGGSRYGAAALDRACAAITSAPCGSQEETLNKEAYSIGSLVAGGVIERSAALTALLSAARSMASYDARRPWTAREISAKVNRSFEEGHRRPRNPVRSVGR
jgi:hypothetical protein